MSGRSRCDPSPDVLYEYQATRSSEHPRAFLKGFSGFLHTDGYQAYDSVPDVKPVGCWSHARRYFVDAIAVLSPMDKRRTDTQAHKGLAYCNRLFAIERDLYEATPVERFAARQKRSQPALQEMHAWLLEMEAKVLPKSLTGKAIAYCRNQWSKLAGFLQDGRLEISNNPAERAIKPFVIGRLCC